MTRMCNKLGIDIGSTTVKIAVIDNDNNILFSDYERHFANIRETLLLLVQKAYDALGGMDLHPMITGSGGMAISIFSDSRARSVSISVLLSSL